MKAVSLPLLIRFFIGWIVYTILLALGSVAWFVLNSGALAGLAIDDVWQVSSRLGLFILPGFLTYLLLYLTLQRILPGRGKATGTVINIIVFHLLALTSFLVMLIFFNYSNIDEALIEAQFIFGAGTIIMAVLPFFQKLLFAPAEKNN